MQVKFDDGLEIAVLDAYVSRQNIQGANRKTLRVNLKKVIDFETLDSATKDHAKRLIVIDGESQYIYDDFLIRFELAICPVLISAATETEAEVTEEGYSFTLAQLTYSEQQAAQLAAEQATQAAAIAELSILVAGGAQ